MRRYTLAIVVALASAIPGSHGTKERNGKGFSWQMKQSIGRADPDSFNGYFLPRYVRPPESGKRRLTSHQAIGNASLYYKRYLGKYMAGNPLIFVSRLQRSLDLHACQRRMERIRR